MKHLQSAPSDHSFYSTYAKLSKSIKASGYFAQVVSALTEIGGIFAASLSILLPVFGENAVYISGAVAIIGTAVLEVGLRVTIPQAVDAVLYKRWEGLHLAMSIAVFILGVVLLATSGILSFKNSQTVVATMVEVPEIDSTELQGAQIRYNSDKQLLRREYEADSTTIAQRYEKRTQATTAAYAGKLGSAKRELSNVYNKERRTGQSYATAKDRARQSIADVKAERGAELAAITTEQGAELAALKADYRAELKQIEAKRSDNIAEVKEQHQAAVGERDNTVNGYGYGLAYFTIICLFIFLAAVILERIHAKGSGITETVELSQYDVSPPAFVEAWQAFRERIQTNVRTRIAAFEERTPAAPLPTSKRELYDPTQLANVRVELAMDDENEGEDRVIRIPVKRRQIGFHTQGSNVRKRTDNEGSENAEDGSDPNATVNASTGHCDNCGTEYTKKVSWQRFCKSDCKLEFHARRHGGRHYSPNYKKD